MPLRYVRVPSEFGQRLTYCCCDIYQVPWYIFSLKNLNATARRYTFYIPKIFVEKFWFQRVPGVKLFLSPLYRPSHPFPVWLEAIVSNGEGLSGIERTVDAVVQASVPSRYPSCGERGLGFRTLVKSKLASPYYSRKAMSRFRANGGGHSPNSEVAKVRYTRAREHICAPPR